MDREKGTAVDNESHHAGWYAAGGFAALFVALSVIGATLFATYPSRGFAAWFSWICAVACTLIVVLLLVAAVVLLVVASAERADERDELRAARAEFARTMRGEE